MGGEIRTGAEVELCSDAVTQEVFSHVCNWLVPSAHRNIICESALGAGRKRQGSEAECAIGFVERMHGGWNLGELQHARRSGDRTVNLDPGAAAKWLTGTASDSPCVPKVEDLVCITSNVINCPAVIPDAALIGAGGTWSISSSSLSAQRANR